MSLRKNPILRDIESLLLHRQMTVFVTGSVLFIITVAFIYGSGYAAVAGHQILKLDVQSDYLKGVAWAVALGLVIAAIPLPGNDRQNLLLAWLAKCWVTLVVMLPYEQFYSLDCFGYYYWMTQDNVQALTAMLKPGMQMLVYPGWVQTRFIESYHGVKVTFAMMGLIAIYLIYRAAVNVVGREYPAILLCLAFVPSVAFWSSIIGKDPLCFLGIALYVYGVTKWRVSGNPLVLAFSVGGVAMAMAIRPWLGVILAVPFAYFSVARYRGVARLFFAGFFAIVLVLLLNKVAGGMGIASTSDLVRRTDEIAHQFSGGTGAVGSAREIKTSITSIPLMIGFMPFGIFTVLFRPLPGEVLNPFGMLAGLENLFFLVWAFYGARGAYRYPEVRQRLAREPVMVWALLLILTWGAMYGFISVQNLGASVRFRLPIVAVFFSYLLALRWMESRAIENRAAKQREKKALAASSPALARPAAALSR